MSICRNMYMEKNVRGKVLELIEIIGNAFKC